MFRRIKVRYFSGWISIGIPTIIFLLIFPAAPIFIMSFTGGQIATWLAVLLFISFFIAALVVSVVTYPFILSLDERLSKNRFFEIELSENQLFWQSKIRRLQIDFTKTYYAEIRCGPTPTTYGFHSSIEIATINKEHKDKIVELHISNVDIEKVYEIFTPALFINQNAIKPREGLYGYILDGENEEHLHFYYDLLAALYRTRENNINYQIFNKFPWEHKPAPKNNRIEVLNYNNLDYTTQQWLKTLESEVISSPTDMIRLTPDYLFGKSYSFYYIFPITAIKSIEVCEISCPDAPSSYSLKINKNKEYEFDWDYPIGDIQKVLEAQYTIMYISMKINRKRKIQRGV